MSAATSPPQIRAATVEALVDQVRELLHAEQAREHGFNARASAVAGFTGVMITVSVTVGAAASRPDLPTPWKWLAAVLLTAIGLSLVGTVSLTVLGVLMPPGGGGFSLDEVRAYPKWATVTQERVWTQGRILRGLVAVLAEDRNRNDRKASLLRLAYGGLALATLLFAALGGILGLHVEHLL